MRHEEESSRSTPDPRSLEERLRLLPLPAVPPHLRERILSAVPSLPPRGKPARPALRGWSLAGLSATAAVALLALFLAFYRAGPSAVQEPMSAPSHPSVLYAATTDPKETDPCCVLPPLPEWRS